VIGDLGETIVELLVSRGFENIVLGGNTMTEIVNAAKNAAKPGDVVLLSTACASFGLFKNYKDRGNQFKQVVNSL
jgi:UDP-N-acetylmuramoylalanine--D-glutamate ligase